MRFNVQFLAIILVGAFGAAAAFWFYAGNQGEGSREDRSRQPILVTLVQAEKREFVNLLEAVGTARANESIELTAKTTETVATVNFKDGQTVPAGFLVAELSAREQAADLNAAVANLRETEQSLKRVRSLTQKGFVTKAALDTAKAQRDSAAARVAAMKSRMTDRAISTPFAGKLGLRRISAGALLRPGDVITTLDDISRIKVDFTVSEAQMAAVKPGQPVRAIAAAYPGKNFSGVIDSIDTRIDPQSRTIAIRAVFQNADSQLLPGMLLTVGIESNRRQSLSLPEQALVPIEAKQYVFVVDADDKADRKEVTIGQRDPGFVEIVSGINGTEKVVVEGTLRLRPGAPIRVADPSGQPKSRERKQKKQQ